MDIAAESDESRSLVRVAIWAGQNTHDPGLYLLNDSIYSGLYSEEAFIRGNTVHVCEHDIYANMRVKLLSQKYNSHIFMVQIATPPFTAA